MNWLEFNGNGNQLMVHKSKLHSRRNPSDPIPQIWEKMGTKLNNLVDGNGVPLSIVVSAANVHDSKNLEQVLEERVVPDDLDCETDVNLCLDAGYVGKSETAIVHGYIPHIRPRGEEKQELEKNPTFRARRWVVEAFNSWIKRFRKLCPRYEKTDQSFYGLVCLASGMIVFNKIKIICG